MIYQLRHTGKAIQASIQLPASKSICNRLQIIRAIAGEDFEIENISDSDDSMVLKDALENIHQSVTDVGHAGTAMRFLTAYFSGIEGERTLTGSSRMKKRPIGILVDSLIKLGAEIDYLEEKGYPPLQIRGKKLDGGTISIPANVSSQYISAIMMIVPLLKNPLRIQLEGTVLSRDYIYMTLHLMKEFGIDSEYTGNSISIQNQPYRGKDFHVENDWSAAAFWYEIASLNPGSVIELEGLHKKSIQGDSFLPKIFDRIYVDTQFGSKGITLKHVQTGTKNFVYDFIHQPDLAQATSISLIYNNIPFHLKGLHNLRIKETDRIAALKNEIKKLGYIIDDSMEGELIWNKNRVITPSVSSQISTYEDHRMAMAFAPAALKTGEIKIENPGVVKKSYKNYWRELQKAGFSILEI